VDLGRCAPVRPPSHLPALTAFGLRLNHAEMAWPGVAAGGRGESWKQSELIHSSRAPGGWRVEILQPLSVRADRLGSMALFDGFMWSELEAAAALFQDVEVQRGTRLTVQGKPDSKLWLLVDGEALVSADAGRSAWPATVTSPASRGCSTRSGPRRPRSL
jgi:hypothetical protein